MITFLAAVMVLAAIVIVSWPLLRRISTIIGPGLAEDTEVGELLVQKDATLFAINELESDFEIGSLSQADYQELRNKYEEKALALIKTVDEMKGDSGLINLSNIDEEIEAKISSLRTGANIAEQEIEARVAGLRDGRNIKLSGKSCPTCGAQMPADSQFCNRCGAALNMKCPGCSSLIGAEDLFCPRCGTALTKI